MIPRLSFRSLTRPLTLSHLTRRTFITSPIVRHGAPATATATATATQTSTKHHEPEPFQHPTLQSVHQTSVPPSKKKSPTPSKSSVMFSVEDQAGSLSSALATFNQYKINLTRIESRPSKRSTDYEFYVDFNGSPQDENVKQLLKELRSTCRNVQIVQSKKVPWFPRRMKDIDRISQQVLDAGADLESDHPGFHDPEYRARRAQLAQIAKEYKQGTPIPRVDYNANEISTWGEVYNKLMPLLQKHACQEHVRLLPLLIDNCGYRPDNIPQLQDISDFLKDCTGFQLRPVAGLLSARNFLYGLAFRVFFSTQYIRHHSKPLYTPEPDIVHELMGHAPLFADQAFADFSQEIGLAAIGATDEQVLKLARCYWFSVEFGLAMQNGERKAYGAGLLSSFGELEYAMSDKPEIREWNPFKAGEQDYPITTYQPIYYAAQSFEDAKLKMQTFSNSFARPFNVRYNPFTQSIEVDGNISVEGDESE